MKKTIALGGLLAVLAALSLPISNLFHTPDPQVEAQLARIPDPHFQKAATIFQNKCIDCHSSGARIPFYANFPIARDLIQEDMEEGQKSFSLTGKLQSFGEHFTPLDLARLDEVLGDNSMPPLRYVALHWDARLSQDDIAALKTWINDRRTERNKSEGMPEARWTEPYSPLPQQKDMDLNADKVALGERLFHDTRLSGDNTISCASCHDLRKGGTDRSRTSTGIRHQIGPINSPTVYNALFNFRQFWDGRAADLKEQASGPVHNPIEMGSNWKQVIGKLKHDPSIVNSFQALYPDGLTGDNIADAIATFESSLVTPNSRFDRYLMGDAKALSAAEQRGYALFKNNCASCHVGLNLGGASYELMGKKANYFADRHTPLTDADNGRFNVTKQEEDRHTFKVPTLRNIAVTAPYMHDGMSPTLRDAVTVMAKYQVGKSFSETELNEMTAFLQTLTGEFNGQPLQ